MGTGSSKAKNGANKVVVADVVIPGKSQPVKVKGQLDLSNDKDLNGGLGASEGGGQAQVKKVAPNKYSLQMGKQNVGTFDVSDDGDFASYLANVSEVTITNVREAADENAPTQDGDASASFQIQLNTQSTNDHYSDDEDWEEVIENLDDQSSSSAPDETDGSKESDTSERKNKLKNELKKKRANLSQEEYEQMIANHKQEVELMNLLREKEKERQKYSLANKVAQRKRKRMARKAEMMEKEGLKHGKGADENERLQELQQEIEKTESQFQSEMSSKSKMMTDAECEVIMATHKRKMAELQEEMEAEEQRRKSSLADKLAERKEKRKKRKAEKEEQKQLLEQKLQQQQQSSEDGIDSKDASEVRHLMEQKQAKFQKEVEAKKSSLSQEKYQQLLSQHQEEMARLKQLLNQSASRQKQTFYDKLAARRLKRGGSTKQKQMSAEEIQQLEMDLEQRQAQFDAKLQEKRGQLSEDEYKQLIESHKQDLTDMREKLDYQRARQRQELLEKLAARRGKKGSQQEEPFTAQDIHELQLGLNQLNLDLKAEVREAKNNNKSTEECQELINEHKSGMEEMQQQLEEEKERMQRKLMEKLKARKNKKEGAEKPMNRQEVKQLQLILDQKEADFQKQLKSKKGQLSEKQMQELISKHQKEQNDLTKLLDAEKARMEQKLNDKLAARKRFKVPLIAARIASAKNVKSQDTSENMDNEQVHELAQELEQKKADFEKEEREMRPLLSEEEYKQLIEAHKRELNGLSQKLDLQRRRQHQTLLDKLAARRAKKAMKGEGKPMTSDEIKALQLALNQKSVDFRQELADVRKRKSSDEVKRIMAKHQEEMESTQQQLDKEKQRMQEALMAKLEARKQRKHAAQKSNIEEQPMSSEDIKQLQLLIDKKDADFKEEMKSKRGKIPDRDYQRILDKHNQEMNDLQNMLDREKLRMEQKLKDKLAARRRRPESANSQESQADAEVKALEREIEIKMATLAQDAKQLRPLLNNEEYDQLLAQHKRELQNLKYQLDAAMKKQKQNFDEKLAARRANRDRLEREDTLNESDDDSTEDEDELGEMVSIEAISATTTLWTTPTQSQVLAVVPLREEYPIRKRKQLYTDPAIFKHLDAHAIKLAQTASLVTQPSFSALVNELVRIGTTELEKVRLIFRWITAQNCDEMDLADAVDDTPLGVLKGLYYTKITFPTLFMRMCRFVGLRCVEICGCAKLKGYQPGQSASLKDYSYSHTWNAVCIDGYWHFVDCNWGVSHIPGSVTFDPFRFEYDEHYFLADPDVIIKTHFSNDASWQLRLQPITVDEFNEAVPLKPDFFKFGFELQSHQKAVVDIPNGNLDIRMCCPSGFILYCKISTVEGSREVSLHGIHFHQFVFIHQMAEDVMACYVRIPEPGHYYATFYAKRQFVEGELNLESQTEICKYYIRNYAPSSDQQPLPISPADHWGPIGISNAGLTPITHTGGIIMCQDTSDIDIRFKRTNKDLKYTHDMTGSGLTEKQLAPYSLQRYVDDELVFTLCLPQVGRYGLHIYTTYPGFPHPVYLCSYLIVMPEVRSDVAPFPAPPTREYYGKSLAMPNLGVSTFTHPDPFIRTQDSQLQITFSLSAKVTLASHLMYDPPRCQDLSNTLRHEFGGGCVTYFLTLNKKGYYHFRVQGKEENATNIPHTCLINYLIRRE